MRNILVVMVSLFFSFGLFAEATKYKVDVEQSYLTWKGTRVGGGHDGQVKIKNGHLEMQGRDIKGGEFIIDMTSIRVDDIKDESRNDRLRNHLLSDDFFSVEDHETAKIEITDAQLGKGGKYNIVGNLTIKGQTHPVMFDAEIKQDDDKLESSADFTIDRTKWGVRYRSGSFFDSLGDRLIHDDIQIGVRLVSNKES